MPTNDTALLQGSWNVTALEVDGNDMPAGMIGEASIAIKGSKFTSLGMGGDYSGTFTVDESAKPKIIDMVFRTGPEKGNTNRGIYKLSGDEWVICLNTLGGARPKKFSSAGAGIAMETLQRAGTKAVGKAKGKRQKAKGKSVGAPTEMEGEWKLVSGAQDGQPVDAMFVKYGRRVIHGNQTQICAGPQMIQQCDFTLNTTRTPKTIDYVGTKGMNAGKTQQGIYAIKGDTLRVCVAAPGVARPTDFTTSKGDGRMETTWQKAKL